VECFDPVSGSAKHELPSRGFAPAFSPDDRALMLAEPSGQVFVFNAISGETLPSPVGAVANFAVWSPTGERIATAERNGKLAVWKSDDGQLAAIIDEYLGNVTALAWSPDGKRIAFGNADGTEINVWYPVTKARLKIAAPPAGIHALAFTPDGRKVMAAHNDDAIRTYDTQSAELLTTIHAATGTALLFSPDQTRVASMSYDLAVRISDVATGKPQGALVSLADDQWLAVASEGHYRGTPGIEKNLVYIAETDDGQQLLSPDEFAKKYGWRNDPERARLAE
jgi:WD40 repeat protein